MMAILSHKPTGFRVGHIVLPNMDAVGAQFCGQVGPIVDDERDVGSLRDRHQNGCGAADIVIRNVLQTQLQARHISRVERLSQRFTEYARFQPRRCDEV